MLVSGELWLRSRGEINHDWLKNQLGTALSAHRNALRGLVTNPDLGRESLQELLAEWESRVMEVEELIYSFEEELSPSVLFNYEPLRSAEFRPEFSRSLKALVHDLWKDRVGLSNLVSTAVDRLEEARNCSVLLRDTSELGIDDSEQLLNTLTAFLRSIRSLSESLSAFPRKLEVL